MSGRLNAEVGLSMQSSPAGGQPNDADVLTAKSIVEFLTPDQREELGIISPEVRARMTARLNGESEAPAAESAIGLAEAAPPGQTALFNAWEDAVECAKCGGRMVRTGSCYTCRDCGSNTACS
jgi:hypothetical protein